MKPEFNSGAGPKDSKNVDSVQKDQAPKTDIKQSFPRMKTFLESLSVATSDEIAQFNALEDRDDPKVREENHVLIEKAQNTLLAVYLPVLVKEESMALSHPTRSLFPKGEEEADDSDREAIQVAYEKAIEEGDLLVVTAKLKADYDQLNALVIVTQNLQGMWSAETGFQRVDGPSEANKLEAELQLRKAILIILEQRGISVDSSLSWKELLQNGGWLK